MAAIAEEIHAVLIERIGYTPAKRTEIYLMDTTDFANGFADVTYFNRTVFIWSIRIWMRNGPEA